MPRRNWPRFPESSGFRQRRSDGHTNHFPTLVRHASADSSLLSCAKAFALKAIQVLKFCCPMRSRGSGSKPRYDCTRESRIGMANGPAFVAGGQEGAPVQRKVKNADDALGRLPEPQTLRMIS